MRKKLGRFIILLIMMTSQIFAGTVYYVDATNGNDNYNGTSPSTAWKTILKVNSSQFIAGDSILFKKGEQWREQLYIDWSGSSGNPITFGSYGSGDKPIINGADIIAWWSLDSGNIWYATCGTEPKQVFFDGVRGNKQTSKAYVDSNKDWYWESNILYVYSTSDPDTAYDDPGIEAQVRNKSINVYGDSYFDVKDLSLRYGNFGIALDKCTYANIYDNDILYVSKRGIYSYESIHLKVYRNNLSYCGVEMPTPEHGIYFDNSDDVDVYENEVSYSWNAGIKCDSGNGYRVYKNYLHNNNQEEWWFGDIHITNFTSSISNVDVYYNILETGGGYAIQCATSGKSMTNVSIYNNTIWDNNPGPGPKQHVLRLEDVDTLNVKNNVIQTGREYILRYSNNTNISRDHNCYYGWTHGTYIGTIDGSNVTWADISSVEINSINQNPLFTDVGNKNFTLQNTSPCIDAGIDVGLTSDIDGNTVPYGYGIDIGAYEYVGENPPLNANADASPISGETPLTVNFTGNATGGTSPYLYSWDFGDGVYSTEQNPSHTYYTDGNYTAILTVTDNQDSQDFDSITITVTPPLTPVVASGNASPTSGNSPLTVYFTGNATGGTPPYLYYWNFGDGQSSNQQNPSHIYNSAGNYTTTLTVTDSNNNQDSDSLIITVTTPIYPLVASCIASPTSGDVPFTVYFTGNATGGILPYSYNWNFGDGFSSTQQNPSHTYNAAGNYTATLTVTDNQGSQDSVSLTIDANSSPIPAYLSCSPSSLFFNATVSGSPPNGQYLRIVNAGNGTMTWSIQDNANWLTCSPTSGTSRGSVQVSVNASGFSPGLYTATITLSSPQAYNSPQYVSVDLRVVEPGVESDPFGVFDSLQALKDGKVKRVGIKTNSDPSIPPEAIDSNTLVSKGNAFIVDNLPESDDLCLSKLMSIDQQDETGRLEIGLKEIQRGFKLQSFDDDKETDENRMTIDQVAKLEPQEHKPQLDTERESTNILKVQIEETESFRIVFTSSLRENISFIGWGEDENTALPIGSTLDTVKGEFSWVPTAGSIGKYVFHFAVTDGSHRSQPLRIEVDVVPRDRY